MLIVNCGSNKLAALDLSGLEKLTSLGCYNNNLTTLDTSKLPEMSFLECYANSLTTLDLTTNSKIATLQPCGPDGAAHCPAENGASGRGRLKYR